MQSPGQKKSIAGALLNLVGTRQKGAGPAAPAAGGDAGDDIVQPAAGEGALENHLGGDEASNYRRYEYDTVAPHVGRSMLEVGSGLGHFSEQFAGRLDYLVVSDNDPYCVEQLQQALRRATTTSRCSTSRCPPRSRSSARSTRS